MKIGIFYLALIVSVLVYLTIKPMMKSNEIGSEGNPIRILLTPSVDAQKLSTSADSLVAYLEAKTGYHVVATFPTSFIAVVEAFGSGKADIAAMNTFSYILAHQKYGVKAALKVIRRDGETTYRGQFIAKANSDIHSIQDLRGKKIAFVDAASTSGYILPKAMLDKEHIKPAEEVRSEEHTS
ncbi:MAG: phosphate/phosphite/phosphonate ABC transporter substrate-binding protein, partial [Bacteroidota bacterium]